MRGWRVAGIALLVGGCASQAPPLDIPVGPLGVPAEFDGDSVSSFLCANEKHFSIAYRTDGIMFSTGVGGVLPMRISGSTAGVRYDGANFTVVTMANKAVVYYQNQPAMTDCIAIMQ